ncbi:ABC transporter ATP-binding protein [Corynebacterium sp. HMSC04H06]|uniref:ABC transporter ATP-binding protein n=1 Tax=Corynebacterium sp. HMSC04H06 TaxID=1581050 RepID=UPI0008A5C952|nr:ABC transporter ATP-binding protein [Corynebacterium sp. HMSC04H06]OFS22471.1 multidrug ABC transporter ATP-binding protein [Corynebacterium sp. HMSC04H06]
MELIRIIMSRSKPYVGFVIAVLVLQSASTAATLYLPSLNASIIDEGVSRGDVPFIWRTGSIMLAVALVQVLTAVAAVWFGSRTAMGLGRDLRREVFAKVTRFSSEDLHHFGTPTLITRATNDVQQVQMVYLMALNFIITAPIMSVGGVIMAIREDAGLSWLVWVSVGVLLVLIGLLIAKLVPLFSRMQLQLDALNGTVREQIAGIRVVRAFVRERFETERFTEDNWQLTQLSLRIGQLFVLMFPIITVILNVATGAVLWFGGHRVEAGDVAVGSLTAFLQYLLQILAAVMMGSFMAVIFPRAMVCAKRITQVLAHSPSIDEPANPQDPPAAGTGCTIEMREVSFNYAGAEEPVLSDISFTAQPGRTTAIIGSTGAGKTTLLSLIPRLYLPASGQVLIDGADAALMSRAALVERVSMVPQKPYLFSGTVASNLRMGNPAASDADLWDALRIAQADFVDDLDMPIAQGGTNVSGGQRQRLCIARMLVARPKVYLFDDSFSALDVLTDARVREAMQERTREATTIIVAQRVASIQDADQILVLEAGRIVARGTHEELLTTSPTYQEIVESQETARA